MDNAVLKNNGFAEWMCAVLTKKGCEGFSPESYDEFTQEWRVQYKESSMHYVSTVCTMLDLTQFISVRFTGVLLGCSSKSPYKKL